jgi:hypothetical protein
MILSKNVWIMSMHGVEAGDKAGKSGKGQVTKYSVCHPEDFGLHPSHRKCMISASSEKQVHGDNNEKMGNRFGTYQKSPNLEELSWSRKETKKYLVFQSSEIA